LYSASKIEKQRVHGNIHGVGRLPHPFCTCLWYADCARSLDEIAKELYRWEQGESVPRLDEAFGYWREENGFTNLSGSGTIKMPQDYTKQSAKSLQRGIESLGQRILEHEQKIAEIEKQLDALEGYEKRRSEGWMKHWRKEIDSFRHQIQSSEEELERRRNRP